MSSGNTPARSRSVSKPTNLHTPKTILTLPPQFIFRHQLQPWHPSSTLGKPPSSPPSYSPLLTRPPFHPVHEAALAVERADPTKFWQFSAALFRDQTSYFDVNVVNETRNQTYGRLAALAGSIGADQKTIYDLLKIGDTPVDGALNTGNQVCRVGGDE